MKLQHQHMSTFKSVGRLEYHENPYKVIVRVDPGISNYYYYQITQLAHIDIQRQRWAPHISVVRKEMPRFLNFWKKYEGAKIPFEYEYYVYNDNRYYWLNVYSPKLEEIRKELGLTRVSAITRGPDGKHRFHITIGNTKHVD